MAILSEEKQENESIPSSERAGVSSRLKDRMGEPICLMGHRGKCQAMLQKKSSLYKKMIILSGRKPTNTCETKEDMQKSVLSKNAALAPHDMVHSSIDVHILGSIRVTSINSKGCIPVLVRVKVREGRKT
jgi:hypothetical protein